MKTEKKIKIIFIGTSDFAVKILSELIKKGYNFSFIVTSPNRRAGRNKKLKESPVSLIAKKNKITTFKPEKISTFQNKIKKSFPDLIIVCDYGQKIPKTILEIPKKGCLNVHPSLLPKLRGPSPIKELILKGENKTGVTIIKMNEKIDKGPIIAKEELKIKKEKPTYQELHNQLAILGANLLIKTIPKWINEKVKTNLQDESRATYTKMITKKCGKINWKEPACEIEKKVRAFNPWPGTYSFFKDKKTKKEKMVKITKADIQTQTKDGPFGSPGKVYMATNDKLAVQTGKDFLIINKIQIENKKEMNVKDFINGNVDFIGTILK